MRVLLNDVLFGTTITLRQYVQTTMLVVFFLKKWRKKKDKQNQKKVFYRLQRILYPQFLEFKILNERLHLTKVIDTEQQ